MQDLLIAMGHWGSDKSSVIELMKKVKELKEEEIRLKADLTTVESNLAKFADQAFSPAMREQVQKKYATAHAKKKSPKCMEKALSELLDEGKTPEQLEEELGRIIDGSMQEKMDAMNQEAFQASCELSSAKKSVYLLNKIIRDATYYYLLRRNDILGSLAKTRSAIEGVKYVVCPNCQEIIPDKEKHYSTDNREEWNCESKGPLLYGGFVYP